MIISQFVDEIVDYIDKNWNDKIELNPKMIKKLTKELNALQINDEDLF